MTYTQSFLYPLVINYNPRLPSMGKILRYYSHLIYNSSNLPGIFPKGSITPSFRRSKNIKEILGAPKRTNLAEGNDRRCFKYKCNRKCVLCRNFLVETDTDFFRVLIPVENILSDKMSIVNPRM